MKDLQELYSERAMDFLRNLEKRRFDAYIMVRVNQDPLNVGVFPCRGGLVLRLQDFTVLFPYMGDIDV